MTDPLARLRRFLQELKRRNVYRVAVTYAVVAFVVLQLANLAGDAFGLPTWFEPMIWVLLGLGFPLALVLAWAFEMTPEGVRRTPEVESVEEEGAPGAARSESRLALKAVVGLGIVGLAAAGGWYLVGGGGGTEPRAGDRSIAVLPFDELGKDEPSTFTEGMHDALLTRLSNISGLEVISRTSVQQYRDTDKTTAEIARELGVKWVVEGGVQEMGDQIQVNAQLIDPRTDTHAWAESYRRDLTPEDLFSLQSELTKKIAESLEAELSPAEQRRVERRPTEDLEAYRLYIRGRQFWNQRDHESLQRAESLFRRAIERDSSYAAPWAGLADVRTQLIENFGYPIEEMGPRAVEAARRALERDPQLAEAYTALGEARMWQHRWEEAEDAYRRALELDPGYAVGHHFYAWYLAATGRFDAAISHSARAVRLDPVSPPIVGSYCGLLTLSGDYGSGLACYEKRKPRAWSRFLTLAALRSEQGRHRQARAAAHRAREERVESGRSPSRADALLSWVHVRADNRDSVTAALDRLRRSKRSEAEPMWLAAGYAASRQSDSAFAWLDRKPRWGDVDVAWLRGLPYFDFIRQDPRYDALLEELGLD